MYRRRHPAPASRRGVILLVVVVLLTLFAIIGLSFVLYAESEANASRIAREAENANGVGSIDPKTLLNFFMGQLLYDASDTDGVGVYSALRGHGLARLMYGWNSDQGAANNTPFNGTGRLHVQYPPTYPDGKTPMPAAFVGQDDYNLINYTYFASLNDGFAIRDPERLGFRTAPQQPTQGNTFYTGGFNPPYTYPDLNNMFLAWMDGTGQVQLSSFHRDWTGFNPPGKARFDPSNPNWYIPSGPQPGVTYPGFGANGPPTNPLLKYLVMRPRPADQLMGGDTLPAGQLWPPTNPKNRTYFPPPEDPGGDVKNLLGAPGGNDSIWMDLGSPVMVDPTGALNAYGQPRKFKALFAPLIIDLGGRLNVNVHGNVRDMQNRAARSNQGWGPWEVNLAWVLNKQGANGPEWQNVLVGNGQVQGRYGADQPFPQPGKAPNNNGTPLGYNSQPPLPATGLTRSHAGWPHFYAPYDFDGADEGTGGPSGPIALPVGTAASPGYNAFPTYGNGYGSASQAELAAHPMVYNYFNPTPLGDRRFGFGDLEAVLRYDAIFRVGDLGGAPALPSPLLQLLPNNLNQASIRQMVTTHSYDLDRPGITPMLWSPGPWTDAGGQQHPGVQFQLAPGNPYPTAQGVPPGTAIQPGPQNSPMFFPPVSLLGPTYGQRLAPGAIPAGSEFTTPGQDPTKPANNPQVDWRAFPTLARYDVNQVAKPVSAPTPPQPFTIQPLTPYPEPDGTTGRINLNAPSGFAQFASNLAQLQQAQAERQSLAAQFYKYLIYVTGAADPNVTGPMPAPQMDAARWLAQLSVNMVDFIDDDDYVTIFNWYVDKFTNPMTPVPYYVYGTELPRVVLNEALVVQDNKNPAVNTGQETDYLWLELHNPFRPDPTLPLYGQDSTGINGSARLYMPPSAAGATDDYGVYRVLVGPNNANMRATDNVTGDPTWGGGKLFPYYDTAGKMPPAVMDFKTAGPPTKAASGNAQPTYFVGPSNGQQGSTTPPTTAAQATTLASQGYYFIGTNYRSTQPWPDPANASPPTPVYTTPVFTYQGNNTPPTITLQRLACPNLPPNDPNNLNPTDPPFNPNLPLNPYVTVDYLENVPFSSTMPAAPAPPTPPIPPSATNIWHSYGKRQPYTSYNPNPLPAGATSQIAQQATNPAQPIEHTFGIGNSDQNGELDQPFDWLVHLDRQLASPMELLNVSGYKPHELTQVFKSYNAAAGKNLPQQHIAPWYDKNALIYRLLEYVEAGPLAAGVQGAGNARIPGKININALSASDQAIFEALCDPANQGIPANQTGPNVFTQQDVDQIFQNLLTLRTPNWNTQNPPFGPTDKPFYPLSVGLDTGSNQYPPPTGGLSMDNTLFRTSNGVAGGLFDVPSQTHPYLKKQLLTKIYNNLTTRSNVFAVWLTVGFFEVYDTDPVTNNPLRPVRLGAEIGRAEGRAIRHRYFAVVDRSVLTSNPGPQPAFDPKAVTSPGALQNERVVPYFSILQ